MKEGLEAKFGQNPHLRQVLLATKGTTLVECNRYDRVWGIGLGLESEQAADSTTWNGGNLLGTLLCEVRDSLE